MKRKIEKIVSAFATNDGDGVKIKRSIGSKFLPQLDPFLLLDELKSDEKADYIGGFPAHPHRGFETVTYMLEGQMRHKDSVGNEGVIQAGDIQWMTAGSGIIHSEMPEQTEGRLWGFQLWTNLPASEKMREPRYQEIASNEIPEIIRGTNKIRVLAGEFEGVKGAVQDISTQPLLLDIQLDKGTRQAVNVPKQHTAIVYVYRGKLSIGDYSLHSQQLAVLSVGDVIDLTAADEELGVLLLAAAPLAEPIARMGPFVMNTQEELQEAYLDYQNGRFA
ncbi:MAG: pirin family protein [Cellvibrionaceae bacterium]